MTDNLATRVLRVSLNDVEPEIWRVIEVADPGTLGDLHGALIGAMGWEDSHLHSFMVGEETYSTVYETLEPLGDDEDNITVAEALPEVGSSIQWMYDWGDGWEHTITVEDTGAMQPGVTYPVLYDGARACPPEDCGGAYIYMEILHMLDDPSYRPEVVDRDEIMNWLDPDFDPDVFHAKRAQWHMRNPGPKAPW
ncbi:MAG: plasmid pRiA4b ORF-3 family protein [Actinomycetota bacterium]|nr:plasmid pRiA4b ORF-3 family protein [Actinomycetota bacterium]